MSGPAAPALFAGDLDDAWVAAIAGALPAGTIRLACPDDLPDAWPEAALIAPAVVLHRAVLTLGDAERLRRLRAREGGPPRVVLIVGPHSRFHQVERWNPLVEAIVPEAIAAETVARHLPGADRSIRPDLSRPRVAIVAGGFELRRMLADACREAGYPVEAVRDWADAPPTGLVLWDVPVLDDDWPDRLAREAKGRALVALIGFADRALVARARSLGAAACLDLPCDPADLAFVLDRLAADACAKPRRLVDRAHEVPPPPNAARPRPLGEPRRPA